jgi:transcriptional regulator with XRE-family HTH domain
MGRYDEEILQLVKAGNLTDGEIAKKMNISRTTVSAAKTRAGLTKPRPEYETRLLSVVPEVRHQSQYGYIMLKSYEKQINGGKLTEKQQKTLEGFITNLTNKVWIYEPEGEGFRQITRLPEHKNYPFYPPPE